MPLVKVNGIAVEVPPGTNMIEAAKKVGVEIPHYCYHPHLSVAGNCRMCLVDVEAGGRGPDIACNMAATEGLAIRTDTPKVTQMRKSVMEFLLVNHPLDCPICDQSGECRLQDYYMEYGQHDSRLADAKMGKGKRQDIGDQIVLDAERCVQCSRCVRFSDEVTGTGELRLFNRSNQTQIGIFPGVRLSHQYQGNLADICPVGALTLKDFRFKKRVWWLKESESVCGGCATGCNILVHHQENEVYRFTPRRNDEVNKSWICDQGRLSYKDVTSLKRLTGAKVDGQRAELPEAANAAAMVLKGAKVGVVFGAKATTEANWAAVKLVRARLPNARAFVIEGNDPDAFTYQDEILVDSDKTPNRFGAALTASQLGSVGDSEALKAALASGEVDALLVLHDDVVGRLGVATPKALVYVGTFKNATSSAAAVVLPAAHYIEQPGTWINRQGRIQRLRKTVAPAGDSVADYAAVDAIGRAFGGAVIPEMPAAIFQELAAGVKALNGLTLKGLGHGGQLITLFAPSPGVDQPGQAAPAK